MFVCKIWGGGGENCFLTRAAPNAACTAFFPFSKLVGTGTGKIYGGAGGTGAKTEGEERVGPGKGEKFLFILATLCPGKSVSNSIDTSRTACVAVPLPIYDSTGS